MNGDGAGATTPERYDRIRAVFLAAARLPPDERERFVERESGGDDAIALEVRALLSHDDPDEAFIARPALAAAESLAGTPKRIGSYVVRAKIGEGGMGAVFECVQENPQPNTSAYYFSHKTATVDLIVTTNRDNVSHSHGYLRGLVRQAMLESAAIMNANSVPYYQTIYVFEAGSTQGIVDTNDEISTQITYAIQFQVRPDQWPA